MEIGMEGEKLFAVREMKGNKKIVQIVWSFFLVLIQFLPATAYRFVYGSKKYITLQRGLGKRTQWQVPIHDGVPSIADSWFQYLHEKNWWLDMRLSSTFGLMTMHESFLSGKISNGTRWTSTLKTDFFSSAWNRYSKFTEIKLGLKQH